MGGYQLIQQYKNDPKALFAIHDRAGRVRHAALAYGQSVSEINEWTRFRVTTARTADDAIRELRRQGKLVEAKGGGDQKSPSARRTVITLADLIDKRPRQTAQDWARLNALWQVLADVADNSVPLIRPQPRLGSPSRSRYVFPANVDSGAAASEFAPI